MVRDCLFVIKTIWQRENTYMYGHKSHDGLRGSITASSLVENFLIIFTHLYCSLLKCNQIVVKNQKKKL